jgi:hypothetical protein
MLPVPRSHIVLAKHFTVFYTEMLSILVAIPCALISSLVINTNGNIVGMDANFAFFGMTFFAFGLFNVLFLPLYFKTGYKTGIPVLVGMTCYIVCFCLFEVIVNLFPYLKTHVDGLSPAGRPLRLVLLAAGLLFYVITMVVSYRISVKRFERVSL